jgi:transcriptional regulator with XRE-family HTH domain
MTREDRPVRTLSEWRKRIPMTQEELANLAGVSLGALRTWEQKQNHPRPAAHRKLAAALGVEPWQIEFGDSPKAEQAAA